MAPPHDRDDRPEGYGWTVSGQSPAAESPVDITVELDDPVDVAEDVRPVRHEIERRPRPIVADLAAHVMIGLKLPR